MVLHPKTNCTIADKKQATLQENKHRDIKKLLTTIPFLDGQTTGTYTILTGEPSAASFRFLKTAFFSLGLSHWKCL